MVKNETLKEIGKSSLALGNIVVGLSIVNGLFAKESVMSQPIATVVVIYVFVATYMAGFLLINKGAGDE